MHLLDPTDLDAAGTLRELETAVLRRRRVEVEDLLLVLHWADLHGTDPRDDPTTLEGITGKLFPGGERLARVGGPGTPRVRELSLCELGVAREVSPTAATSVVADALDLRHRLPLVWDRVKALQVEVWVARKCAALTRELSSAAVGEVDAVLARAIGTEAPGRVLDLCRAKAIEADPETHDARVAAEARRRHVTLTRTDEAGLRTVIARVRAGDAHWVDATIARVAEILSQQPDRRTKSIDELRADAFGWLARPAELLQLLLEHTTPDTERPEDEEPAAAPARPLAFPADLLDALRSADLTALRPRAVLYVHLHEAAIEGAAKSARGVARVEGLGPHTVARLRELLGHAAVTVRGVCNLGEQTSTVAYEHPASAVEKVHLLRYGDRFPHGSRVSRLLDLDHPVPYSRAGPPGQSGVTTSSHTAQPLSRRPHRAKTHLRYGCTPLGEGRMLWTTPHGLHRIVDAAGTRVIDDNEARDWTSTDSLTRAITCLYHKHLTGQLQARPA